MKLLLQRCKQAEVSVAGDCVGSIESGLVLFVGLANDDNLDICRFMAEKVVNLRIFPDAKDRFQYSLLDKAFAILAIPQFTLFADARKGRRPEFFSAMPPQLASPLFDSFIELLKECGINNVQTGVFGAMMQVSVVNDGPVSILLDSKELTANRV